MVSPRPSSTLFPYTTLFRSLGDGLAYDVHVVNPDPHYVTTYSDSCRSEEDTAVRQGHYEIGSGPNTEEDFHGGIDGGAVREIKVVDNTGAPTPRQPSSFQLK